MTTTLTIPTLTAKSKSGLSFNVTLVPTKTENHIRCGALINVKGTELEAKVEHGYRNGTVVSVNTVDFFKVLGTKSPTKDKTMLISVTTNCESILEDIYLEFSENITPYYATKKTIKGIKEQNEKVAFIANDMFVDTSAEAKKIGGEVYYSKEMLNDMDMFSNSAGTYVAIGAVERLVAAGYTVYKVDSRAGKVEVIAEPVIVQNSIVPIVINRSEIMKNAWRLVKEAGLSISAALKRAWAFAKQTVNSLFE